MKYTHVFQYLTETPWAILPSKMAEMMALLELKMSGVDLTTEEIRARIGQPAPQRPMGRQMESIAVLPLHGVISQRASMFTEASGGTSTEQFAQMFRDAMADDSISGIIFSVDSPGGSVFGVEELATEIYKARGRKEVVAVASSQAASAAYWLATAADSLVVTPGGEVGSVGVFAQHQDLSAYYEREGVRTSLISAGRFKTEGSPFQALGEEARTAIQERVNEYYSAFTRSVARQRGVTVEAVRNGFGEGRVVGSRKAIELGMADRVGTLESEIERMLRARRQTNGARASIESPAVSESLSAQDNSPWQLLTATSGDTPNVTVNAHVTTGAASADSVADVATLRALATSTSAALPDLAADPAPVIDLDWRRRRLRLVRQ